MGEYLFKAQTCNGAWVEGLLAHKEDKWYISNKAGMPFAYEVRPETICRYTGKNDVKGKKIWENDILRGHGNPNDLAKVVFGEFYVIDVETLSKVDSVIGWHTEVIPTDAISRAEPFCLPMPLTDFYIERSEWEVIGNCFNNPKEEH